MMRIELLYPTGGLMTSETYNKLFTIHGTLMVWFFLIPSIPAVLGNFVLPMMIGARDVAFPKLNLMSWYLFVLGGAFATWSLIRGGVDTGWTFYTPYSTTYANSHVISMAAGVFVAGFSTIVTGINFIVTTHKMRAPGLTWFRLPLFVWSLAYSASLPPEARAWGDIAPIELVPQDITRVCLNLFGNGFYAATKRQREGGDPKFKPTLRVSTRDLGDTVEIRARDNGVGIPPDIRDKLFQPFFTTKPTGEGTGLGLSITYDIVTQQHGGTIEVDSRPDEFTEFTVRLPRRTTAAGSAA